MAMLQAKFEPLDPSIDKTQIHPGKAKYSKAELLRLYRAMMMGRKFEQKLIALYRQGKILGAVYVGMGQEAIAVGIISLLRPSDIFNSVARNTAGWFLRGVEPRHVFARWFGKDVAPSHGRDLGLFLADLERYNMAPYHNGSMASWIPSGAGFALAFKMRRQDSVYVAFTGEGATSPGDFYEGLNFASIHKLPLVIICENNQFAYSTPNYLQMPVKNVADRAPAFNCYSEIAFGNDIFKVREVGARALAHARCGKGPALIEFKTFRQRGHGEHDDAAYVTSEMRAYWEARDPIRLFVAYLAWQAKVRSAELKRIDDEITEKIEADLEWANAQPFPDAALVSNRLYAPEGEARIQRGLN